MEGESNIPSDFFDAYQKGQIEVMCDIAKKNMDIKLSTLIYCDITRACIFRIEGFRRLVTIIMNDRPQCAGETFSYRKFTSTGWTMTILEYLCVFDESRDSLDLWDIILPHVPQEHFNLLGHKGIPPIARVFQNVGFRSEAWILEKVDLLVQYGASPKGCALVHPNHLADLFHYSYLRAADYVIEHGARTDVVYHPLIGQRNNCFGATAALSLILLKGKHVEKDIIKYVLAPAVWSTRFESEWENKTKKRK